METDPPFHEFYKSLFNKNMEEKTPQTINKSDKELVIVEECELPLIDLSRLYLSEPERTECKADIARASQEWGFFQVVNHGISPEILEKMRSEQERVFKQPFDRKTKEYRYLNFSAGSYRWGTPSATSLGQLSWSEAFHIPLSDISRSGGFDTLSCLPSTCYLRLNRYPPCPLPLEVFGLTPHTDSDFLTILHQDQVGGLQLVKDGRWIAVKPNPEALIINIGDLFQAWSNGVYKSVRHRVIANPLVERFSTAYFFCPSYDTVIESCREPAVYRKFSFREYRQQIHEDVQKLGTKIGLPRFRV
ncbi:Gibberellin 2-beta-dioxygenase 8 [Morella rubra]|uniref:Gibberellin 2-beta-dioxygenase 8 n=1 Tax=Morella rubra TaxID=262757 RepID=A0A6A1UMB9_9ROSI|nr:Gibberellin 2-beta-dioxygenase 8 [Morella rubra]KAB1201336.1 Gibberellin 2-beta-dioxygenase 8 [Morella rubra]KAB1221867.1 Gibberellin 2-beta-dioxygenase 8 [Morella rubra]